MNAPVRRARVSANSSKSSSRLSGARQRSTRTAACDVKNHAQYCTGGLCGVTSAKTRWNVDENLALEFFDTGNHVQQRGVDGCVRVPGSSFRSLRVLLSNESISCSSRPNQPGLVYSNRLDGCADAQHESQKRVLLLVPLPNSSFAAEARFSQPRPRIEREPRAHRRRLKV